MYHKGSVLFSGHKIICKGQCTELSCPGTNSMDKANINVLWKKQTGETVIWRDSGKNTIGETYINRTVDISEDLSLLIGECDQSDQGVYILCINGQTSCKVRLLVNDKCKRSSENMCGNLQSTTDATEEPEDPFETSSPRHHIGVISFLSAPILISGVVFAYNKRKNTNENNTSKCEEMSIDCTVVQSNTASEIFI